MAKKIIISIIIFLLSAVYAFPQPPSVTYNGNTYFAIDYTTPSYTELCRCIVLGTAPDILDAINNLKDKEMPYNIVMNIYGDPTSQMAFNWFTNSGINTMGIKVQIVEKDDFLFNGFSNPLEFYADSTPINDLNYNVPANNLLTMAGIANNTQKSYISNKALATGLTSNTEYYFRVGKNDYWSETGTFTTAKDNKDEFSFIYVSDPQAHIYELYNHLHNSTRIAFDSVPDASFMLHCGDLVESGTNNAVLSSEWEWEQFFEKQQEVFYHVPLAPVLGNHDNNSSQNFTKHFNTNNPTFDKDSASVPGSVYSFVYGDALFLALNSEACYYSLNYNTPNDAYADSLINWMRTEVAAHPDVKWRIVYYHKTVYPGSAYIYVSNIIHWHNKIVPIFDELFIDLAFEGHEHIYKVAGPIYNQQLVPEPITNQTIVPIHPWSNVTGKFGGTFNTQSGTLYFLNSSEGEKKYCPLDLVTWESITQIQNYGNLMTGRVGQTGNSVCAGVNLAHVGNPTFSSVKVSTNEIVIASYEIFNNGTTQLFDSIIIIRPDLIDAELVSIITDSITFSSEEYLNIIIKNNGSFPLTEFDIIVTINGETVLTETFLESIPSRSAINYQLNNYIDLSAPITYEIIVFLNVENDYLPVNNGAIANITNFPNDPIDLYAYKVWDITSNKGFVSFTSDNPTNLTTINNFTPNIPNCELFVGEYVDGYFYAYNFDTNTNTTVEFIKIERDTWEIVSSSIVNISSHIPLDMAYDYTEGIMYYLGANPSSLVYELYTIDMETGAMTSICLPDREILTLACSYDGKLLSVDLQGNLCSIDKNTGITTIIGSTGYTPANFVQSMAFDHNTDRLFWTLYNSSNSKLIEISANSGITMERGNIENTAQLVGLHTIKHFYTINAYVDGGNGTITPSGETIVGYGENQTFYFTPDVGYHISQVFVNGISNPDAVSSGSYTFTNVIGSHTIEVSFEINQYQITYSHNELGTLSVMNGTTHIPSGTSVEHFTILTIIANPDEGHSATTLTVNGQPLQDNTHIVVETTDILCLFTINQYQVTYTHNEFGTLSVMDGETIIQSGTSVEHFTNLTIIVYPDEEYSATTLTVNGQPLQGNTHTVVEETDILCLFTINQYQVIYEQPENGTLSVMNGSTQVYSGTSVDYNTILTITAVPNEGYSFTEIIVNGQPLLENSYLVVGQTHISCFFMINQYQITYTQSENGNLIVQHNETNVENGDYVEHGTILTITAIPDDNYHIDILTVNEEPFISGNNHIVNEETTIVCLFAIDTYTITASVLSGNGSIIPDGITTIPHGSNQSYAITPNIELGWYIQQVFIDDESNPEAVINGSHTFENISNNHTIEVIFDINRYIISVSANPTNGGTVTGEDIYEHGQTVTVTATPYDGYEFLYWEKDDIPISFESTFNFEAIEDAELIAFFDISGINEKEIFGGFKIFPNPAFNVLKIVRETNEKAIIEIFNSAGSVVQTLEITDTEVDIDLMSFASGVYLIRLTTERNSSTQRFVKKGEY